MLLRSSSLSTNFFLLTVTSIATTVYCSDKRKVIVIDSLLFKEFSIAKEGSFLSAKFSLTRYLFCCFCFWSPCFCGTMFIFGMFAGLIRIDSISDSFIALAVVNYHMDKSSCKLLSKSPEGLELMSLERGGAANSQRRWQWCWWNFRLARTDACRVNVIAAFIIGNR